MRSSIFQLISVILLIVGQIATFATLGLGIIGIVFLVQSSSEETEESKKKKIKKGITFCIIGPGTIILIIILYAISSLLFRFIP